MSYNNCSCSNNKFIISKDNNCDCKTGYSGVNCSDYSCFDIPYISNNVCNKLGKCMSYNNCSCFNYKNINSKDNNCNCNNNYDGVFCDSFKCNGIDSNSTKTCNGQGVCVDFNNCTCFTIFFSGSNCDNPQYLVAIVTPIGVTLLISVLLIIFIIILLIFLTFFILVMIIIIISITLQRNKKTFLLKNKELSDKLLLMNDLNNIPFNLIKFYKKDGNKVILGKGASSTVNFINKIKRFILENIMEKLLQ
jgi:hypothetical protein